MSTFPLCRQCSKHLVRIQRLSSSYAKRTIASSSRLLQEPKQSSISKFSELPRPRFDYRDISENAAYKSHNAFNRKAPVPVGAIQKVARLYETQKRLKSDLGPKLHARSTIGDKIRDSRGIDKDAALQGAKMLKTEILALEQEIAQIDEQLLSLASTIPNDTHPDSPLGPEAAAKVLAMHGPEPIPASPSRDHVSVGHSFKLLDQESAASVTGSSWYYLLNEAVLLELALTQYAMTKAMKKGFTPITTPDVVKADVAMRCGFQPRDNSDPPVHQMYHLQNADSSPELILSGTAEIPLAGFFANKIYEEKELPVKLVGIGRAFRSEAGARGADTRGLYRVHQFSKLELFAVCPRDQSNQVLQEMLDLQVDIFSGLGLPLRVLDMPTEELGASAYRKYDIEAWMPGRGSWGEISSTSNCTDYQSRRLHIRYRPQSPGASASSLPFAHTLNGTAAAIPRLIVALLENGVELDHSGRAIGLRLPSILKPFWLNSSETSFVIWC